MLKRDIIVLSAGCTSGGLENCGLMSPAAAELAGEGLKGVCRKLGIPPVLNFGPCLAIGRLEIVATELARAWGDRWSCCGYCRSHWRYLGSFISTFRSANSKENSDVFTAKNYLLHGIGGRSSPEAALT